MKYTIFYRPDVKQVDIQSIPENLKKRIRKVVEERLMVDPEKYGEPLRKGLQGYRKLRIGGYRVIYKVYRNSNRIRIFKIGHRKEVYKKTYTRVK